MASGLEHMELKDVFPQADIIITTMGIRTKKDVSEDNSNPKKTTKYDYENRKLFDKKDWIYSIPYLYKC